MSEKPRFLLEEVIGRGQFGNVWKAKWLNAPLEPTSSSNNNQNHQQMNQNYHHFNQRPASVDQNQIGRMNELARNGSDFQQTHHQNHRLSYHQQQQQQPQVVKQDKYVAVKRIKFYDIPNSRERAACLKEVKLLQELKHPNIIDYKISFIEQNELFIVLELADGGDLSKLIKLFQKRKTLIPERSILKYFTQVCSAIEYIHSKRILHRDIKPANIFMTHDGVVKLGDFGLGRFFSQNTQQALTLLGTFYYMSPERIQESGYSFSSDVWSLGCVLYELITLHSPFSIVNNQEQVKQNQTPQDNNNNQEQHQQNPHNLHWLFDRIIRAEYPSLNKLEYSGVSSRLRQLATDCLVPDPNSRPQMGYICEVVNEIHYKLQVAPTGV